ncbi:MAG: DUF3391 domain-containing protein [Gammaproteobacteria bacterium]|nr:DUF3391 domain-containing protein [Gammaproteobacteria bacterium]
MSSEVKIKIDGLLVGMYVSKIDRSWMDVPISLEGMVISNNDDIDLIRKHCEYVYVDTNKGRSPSPMYWVIDENETNNQNETIDLGKNEFSVLRKETYPVSSSLSNELTVAKDLYRSMQNQINSALKSLQFQDKVDIDTVHDVAVSAVDSVIRHPDALRLVLELKESNKSSYNRALGTSIWCAQIGRSLGFEKYQIEELTMGGLLLDVGKTKIPATIINKSSPLTPKEIEMFRAHVDQSVSLLIKSKDIPHNVMRMVATHHERYDGSGYPMGLKDADMPVYGKIAALADSFDAMTHYRSYTKGSHSPHQAISDIYQLRGKFYNPDLVDIFIHTIGVYPAGSIVELNTGEVAVVFSVNSKKKLKPVVMVVTDKNKEAIEATHPIDLSAKEDYYIIRGLSNGEYNIELDVIEI